jgi:hypothetical protein
MLAQHIVKHLLFRCSTTVFDLCKRERDLHSQYIGRSREMFPEFTLFTINISETTVSGIKNRLFALPSDTLRRHPNSAGEGT